MLDFGKRSKINKMPETLEILDLISGQAWQIFKEWWLLIPVIILLPLFLDAWLWWRRELWEQKQKYVLLEIRTPPEVLKPYRAMEQVFSSIWSIYSSLSWRKLKRKWWDGRKMYYFCLEIASIADKPHFFVRMRQEHQDTFKAAIYSQYPDIEIEQVDDYSKYISQNVPNKDWDVYGFDEVPIKSDVYPLKTYPQFFEERAEITKEEKRVDPISTLLEGLAELKPGEQMWIQIRVMPVTPKENNYKTRGKKLIDRLVYRREKKKKSIVGEFGEALVGPRKREERKEGEAFIPPEMKLTPREREIVKSIEDKIGKEVFQCNIRGVYFGKRDIFQRGRRTLAEQFFASFNTQDLNGIKKWRKTKTRIYHFWIKRRLYLRKRRMFRRYVLRETPLYPRQGGTFILSTEELATIFHPPIEAGVIGTFLPLVESKKAEAPAGLPIGEPETGPGSSGVSKKDEAPSNLPTG